MRIKILIILACSVLLPSLGLAKELDLLVTVKKVISADTFVLTNDKTIRLIGVDAPEDRPNAKAKADARRWGQSVEDIVQRGKEATAWIKGKLKGKKLFIRFDEQRMDEDENWWVYAYLYDESRFAGGIAHKENIADLKFDWWEPFEKAEYVMINGTVIRAGYGMPAPEPPNTQYEDVFNDLYREAKEDNEGLWNTDFFDVPCREEGKIVAQCVGCVIRCCQPTEPIFKETADGRCGSLPVIGSVGYCSYCGNNKCESSYGEDRCTCRKDCN